MIQNLFSKYMSFKNITFALVSILFIFFIFYCKNIALLFFASYVIACSINPVVDKISKNMNRKTASALVIGLALLIIVAVFVPVCIVSFEQIKMFISKLPNYIDNFDEYLFSLPILKSFNFLANDADSIMEEMSLSSADIFSSAIDIGKSIGTSCVYLMISVILIFNFVADKKVIKQFYLRIFPSNMRKRAEEVGKIISNKMGGYVIALIVTSLSVGIVMLIGLLVLNVPYAHLLAIITAVFDIIPVIGPAAALVVCLLATYDVGSGAVISVIAIFTLAQLVENNLVRPYIFGKVMNLHPVVIFLFLFITAEYLGVIGVIFAPAIAALCAVLFEELYLKKIN